MSKNLLRWMTRRLSLITAVLVTTFILAGWFAYRIEAAPAARPEAHSAARSQVVGVGMYDDYDPSFRYTGHWQSGNFYPTAYQNTMHFTSDPNARAALTFQGTGFALYRVTYTNRGLMDVYIDGSLYASPNNYSDTPVWQAPLVINGLPDGVHTVEFANTRTAANNLYMDIDAVRVLEGSALPPPDTATTHPVTATSPASVIPPTDTPIGALPNLSANQNQPLVPQALTVSPSPTATDIQNAVSSTTGIVSPLPTLKGLLYSGEEASAPNNLFTINPIAGDTAVQVSNIGAGVGTGVGFNYPVWSPDGASVAFSDASGLLQILNIASGAYSAPSTTSITISSPVAWDPYGAKRIAYIDGSSGNALKVVDFSGSTAVVTSLITSTGTGTGYSQVSWNKTTNVITFQATGTSTVSVLDNVSAACIPTGICTAVPVPLDSGANSAVNSDPAWSPSGLKLAYVSNRGNPSGAANNDVYVFDATTGVSTKVSSGTSSKHSPSWNTTGTQLVYVDSQTTIQLVDKANTASPVAPVMIHTAVTGSLLSVSWSSLYVGPPTLTPTSTITLTPSSTPVTLTGATLTALPLLPNVGDTVIFAFTITNSSSFTLSSLAAQLQVSGTTMAIPIVPTLAAPTTLAPNATVIYTFSHVVTASDACNLAPIASFSASVPTNGTVTEVVSQLTNGTTINVQRLGLSTGTVLPTGGTTAVGQTLTTTVNVTNNGCLSENVLGNTMFNNTKTSDPVTSSGQATLALPVGNTATFTSTHTVTSADVSTIGMVVPDNNGLRMVSYTNADRTQAGSKVASAARSTSGVVVSYTFTATGSTSTGTALTSTVVSSSTNFTIGTTSGTPGTGTSSPFSVVLAASVTTVSPGGAFTYTITVTNNTGATVNSVAITDSLPTTVTAGTATSTAGTATVANGIVTVAISSLATGQSVTVTINVTASKTASSTTPITNTASGTYSGGTSVTSNTVSVTISNGASSLPVTGYGDDQATSIGLLWLVVVGIGAAVFGASRYLTRRRSTSGR